MPQEIEAIHAVRNLLLRHSLSAVLLQRASSFAWATDGADSTINRASTQGEAALLITGDEKFVLCNNIEAPRLLEEEALSETGWQVVTHLWYDGTGVRDQVEALIGQERLGADLAWPGALNLSDELALLRARLSPAEVERLRALGHATAAAMNEAIRGVQPGQSEFEIAARMAHESEQRGLAATVLLVATDKRIDRYRHPLPTPQTLERYAELILCTRQHGLICSITRSVYFGKLPPKMRDKMEACAYIDATYMLNTRPRQTLGAIFERAVDAYAAVGHDGEWRLHHQGGTAGYEPRETLALPGSTTCVEANQAFAWNPSITGVKSEDTMLVGEARNEVLTAIDGWPITAVEIDGQAIERPLILEVT